jgi:hypothetical protein
MIPYGDACCAGFTAPFEDSFETSLLAPLVTDFEGAFRVREAVGLEVLRWTGAEATEAGILGYLWIWNSILY